MGVGLYTYQSSGPNRISGMFSGMDTSSIVSSLMSLQQAKVDKIFMQREKAQWKNDAYSEVNKSVNNLRNSFLSVLGSNSVVKNSTFNNYKAEVSQNNSIKITATSDAAAGGFNIKSVQTATSASYTSEVRDLNTTDSSIKRQESIKAALAKISDQDVGDTLEVEVNGKKFSFDTSESISHMMSTINNDADANAVFTYSEMTETFSISYVATGENSKIEIKGFEAFGLGVDPATNPSSKYTAGRDAIVELTDGSTIKQTSNNFTLDGLKFELLSDFQATGADTIRVDVTRDNSATVTAIKGFIDEYNKLVEQLNKLYTGANNRDYQPLTEAQRADMTEKEAEQWDEMAKSGALRNDAVIGSLMTNLRSTFLAEVEGTGMSAADIGLTTMKWDDMSDWKTDQGKIVLDEDALLAALEKNPGAVQDVFNKVTYKSNGDADVEVDTSSGRAVTNSGLFTRISEIFSDASSRLRNQSMQATSQAVSDYNTKMNEMLSKMSDMEEKYWRQYSALETALSKMQSTQSWLAAQLGTGS